MVTALLASLTWIFKCLLTCGHRHTPVAEGKCYCPDCGKGVIYQWVVVRCTTCRVRVDSRILLRQIMPSSRCCPKCGEHSFQVEYLEAPSYFHLHKAQLIVRDEHDYLQDRFHYWTLYNVGQSISRTVEDTFIQTRRWLTTSPQATHLKLLPSPVKI
jgi:ribosomal protein S27AE